MRYSLRRQVTGKPIVDVCREAGISEQTFHRWKRELGMLEVDQAKQLKELLKEALEKKMVSPAHKREMAQTLVSQGRCSARAACRHFGLHRSTFGYQAKEAAPWLARLRGALRRKSEAHPELGYPKITRLLKKDGWDIGKRLVQRLRQEMGLKCPTKKPRQRRRGPSTGLPTKATHQGHVWTCDFVADRTAKGGSIRMLTVLDEFTRVPN